MIQLLTDVNIEGHIQRLAAIMQSPYWKPVWDHLQISILHFHDVGLLQDADDAAVYQTCQLHAYYLITSNRNEEGPVSLGSMIRHNNTEQSLPVFTIADADQVLQSRDYQQRVVESLFEALLNREILIGSGRLYLP